MSAAAPNPNNLIMLAVVGVGVYWFMTRRKVAAATAPTQAVSNPYTGVMNATNTLANVVGTVSRLFNGGMTPGTVDGRSASPWSPSDTGANNPSAFSSAVDGAAYNPPGDVSPYDSVDTGTATGADLSLYY